MTPMVKAQEVCKSFGALHVLKGITLEVGDRKLKRWSKNCKQFIYPIAVTHTRTVQRALRTSKPKSRW